ALVLTFSSFAAAQSKPALLFQPLIVVDANGSGSTIIEVRNDGTDKLPLMLTTSDITSKATDRKINAQVVFGKPAEANGMNPYQETIDPKQVLLIRATVSGVTEAGELDADLVDKGVAIGKLRVSRRQMPFS